MSDPVLDTLARLLEQAGAGLSSVTIGRPRIAAQPRAAYVWFGGGAPDSEVLSMSLGDIAIRERAMIAVLWPVPDAPTLRTEYEYEARATYLAVRAALHGAVSLGGLVDLLRVGDTLPIWDNVAGARYQGWQMALELERVEAETLALGAVP